MKIMVFDVAAESGGALSILNDFYNECSKNESNNYIFVLSKPELKETSNIRVVRYPWIKKSWIHRLYFDNFVAPKKIREYEIDQIISLQNIIIPNTNVYQTLYIHNSLPFVDYKFPFIGNKLLWIYQNVLSKCIYKSINKANKVIVQTNWIKKVCVKKLNINEAKIEVIAPRIEMTITKQFHFTERNLSTFFYPASGVDFKNHKIIVNACLELKKAEMINYRVVFTLTGNENKNISEIYNIVKQNDLPVIFIGSISRNTVFEYYLKSVLIFPSYIESFGLPLLEARLHGTPILASNCAFSHEILDGYEKVKYFDPFNSSELKKLMSELIRG